MQFNLRNKFLLPTLALIILGMGISTLISYNNAKDALEKAITGRMVEVTRGVNNQFDSWIGRIKQDMINWTELDMYQSELYTQKISSGGHFDTAHIFNKQLVQTLKSSLFYDFIGLANVRGHSLINTQDKDLSVGGREFFKKSMADKIYVSDIYASKNDSSPVFTVSRPVYGIKEFGTETTNEIVGVLYCVVKLSYFENAYIDTVDVGKTGFSLIYNRYGKVAAHTDNSRIFDMDIKNYNWGNTVMGEKEGVLIDDIAGVEHIASHKTFDETGWGVVVGISTDEVFSSVAGMRNINFILGLVITVLTAICIWFLCGKLILKPIAKVKEGLKDIAQGEGDLTTRLDVPGEDEVGELSKWFNTFMEKLQRIVSDIGQNAETLNASSGELSSLSGTMSQGADIMSSKSNTVASSADEMSGNINSVAAAMEQASTNMNLVASAAEEMTATINEIAQNSEKSRTITGAAVTQSDDASKKIDELGHAAQEIGKVTETITEISEQTNLLALNATIEAARAGEAGKGFAVVANEIKELARQTAEATQDIKDRIDAIQSTTSESVTQVDEIAKVINEVNDIVSTIAAAVEEQSVTTKEIAGNVSQASSGIQEVSEKMSNSSTVASQIARDIAEVNQSSAEMSNSSSQVDLNANELSNLATQLKDLVGKFRV